LLLKVLQIILGLLAEGGRLAGALAAFLARLAGRGGSAFGGRGRRGGGGPGPPCGGFPLPRVPGRPWVPWPFLSCLWPPWAPWLPWAFFPSSRVRPGRLPRLLCSRRSRLLLSWP